MSRIFRYELEITDEQTIELPLSARPVSVAPGRSGDHIDMWAWVPEVAPGVGYTFRIIGTGNPLPDGLKDAEFLGTCVMSDGMVWHTFLDAP